MGLSTPGSVGLGVDGGAPACSECCGSAAWFRQHPGVRPGRTWSAPPRWTLEVRAPGSRPDAGSAYARPGAPPGASSWRIRRWSVSRHCKAVSFLGLEHT